MDVVSATHANANALAQRQSKRIQALLDVAGASDFYRAHWKATGIDRVTPQMSLQDLPPVDKATLMNRFEDWVTQPQLRLGELKSFVADPTRIGQPYLGRFQVWESSGSCGTPGIFVQDAQALAVYDALEALRRSPPRPLQRWMDPWFLTERLAFVGALEGHFASYVAMLRLQAVNPVMSRALRCFSILDPAEKLYASVQDWNPSILATYPTAAVMLARAVQDGDLRIAPKEVWTGGETLTPAARAYIEQSFGCTVRNSYGCSEFLTLGWECSAGRMHLNADWVVLEPVDARGHAVPVGTAGHTTLLTNLANRVQPLVRYALGDQVRYTGEACPCGCALPVIEVEGRCDDVLVLAGRQGRSVTLLPLAVSTVLEDEAGVFDFQLCQHDAHTLSLRVGGERRAAASTLKNACRVLRSYVHRSGAPDAQVLAEADAPPSRSRSGKVKRIVAAPG